MLIRERRFYRRILTIAIPIALQNLITLITSMMDTVMLGRADDTGVLLSASSLANQPFFILTITTFGLAGAASVLTAQYWGKGDTKAIRAIFSLAIKAAAIVSFLMGTVVLLFPETIMGLFSNDAPVIAKGVDYLRIIGFAYYTFGISNTIICTLRGIEVVRISVIVNLASLFTNVFLNWVLIFGNLGAPALGIRGAAIATLCARLLEFVITIVYLFFIDKRLQFRLRDLLHFHKTLASDLLRCGTPVVINELAWSLGITVQAAILGHIRYAVGDPVAANSIAGIVQQLSTVFIFGIANAAAVMVGMTIGEGKQELAKKQAHTFKYLSFLIGVLACGLILLLKDPFINFYHIPEATKELARQLMVVIAFVTIFVSSSSVLIVGVLRGAGDTTFCLASEMVCLWLIATPLAFVLAHVLHAPVPLVLIGMKMDEPCKTTACLIRMRGDKWLRSLTREFS